MKKLLAALCCAYTLLVIGCGGSDNEAEATVREFEAAVNNADVDAFKQVTSAELQKSFASIGGGNLKRALEKIADVGFDIDILESEIEGETATVKVEVNDRGTEAKLKKKNGSWAITEI